MADTVPERAKRWKVLMPWAVATAALWLVALVDWLQSRRRARRGAPR